jgi:hypothetical protein
MRITLTAICLMGCITAALAQNNISNPRDSYGNIVRNTGMNPVRNSGQPQGNNVNGAVGSAPAATTQVNSATRKSK